MRRMFTNRRAAGFWMCPQLSRGCSSTPATSWMARSRENPVTFTSSGSHSVSKRSIFRTPRTSHNSHPPYCVLATNTDRARSLRLASEVKCRFDFGNLLAESTRIKDGWKTEGAMLKNRADLFWAPLGEGGLVLAIAAIAWATNQPLIFASLGPTAYELVEQPQLPSARTYNVIVGHLIGLGSGFLAVYLMNAWAAPNVMAGGVVSPERVWAMTISAALTTLVSLVLRAGQPAALATTLLISTGAMQTRRDAVVIVAGILLIAALGEPVRRFRLKYTGIRPVSS